MADAGLTPGEQPKPATARRGRGATVRLIVLGLVAVYAILFIAFNTHHATVNFVFGSTKLSVIWVILLSIGLGVVLGLFVPQLRRRRRTGKS